MKWRYAALGTAGALAIAATCGVVALHALVDPEHLKRIAHDKAQQAWSRDLTISSIGLEFRPWPALHAQGLKLAPAPGAKAPYLIESDNTIGELAIAPLFRGEVRFAALVFDGVSIRSNTHVLKMKGRLDDISQFGVAGATTNGRADLDWGETHLSIEGRIPLDGTLAGHAVHADLKTAHLNDMLAFFDVTRRPTAPIEAHFDSSESGGVIEARNIRFKLGQFDLSGTAKVVPGDKVSTIDASLAGNHLDWVQALLDAGAEPLPPLEPDELFYAHPFAWNMLVALQGWRGSVDAQFTGIRMRSGIDLQDVKMRSTFDGDHWNVNSYTTGMLGGTAAGTLQLDGRRQSAKLTLDGSGLLLERWFRERGSPVPFKGGPMKVNASVTGTGSSMRALVQSMTGPITIRMGRGLLDDAKAGAARAKMTGTGAPDSGIAFECAAANLPFQDGRATRKPAFAALGEASYLITSGSVDFRSETYDLHGPIKPRTAGKVSVSTFAGDVMITGKIRHPHMTHDASKTPSEVARAGLAVVTLGTSAIASTSADATAAEERNPCEAVF